MYRMDEAGVDPEGIDESLMNSEPSRVKRFIQDVWVMARLEKTLLLGFIHIDLSIHSVANSRSFRSLLALIQYERTTQCSRSLWELF